MNDRNQDRTKERSNIVNVTSTVIVVALFAIAALVLLATGMKVYEKVVLASNENFELRTSLSYVATKVRQYDESGMISVEEYDGIKTLKLSEDFDDFRYNTLLYFKDGALYELTQPEGYEPEMDFGFKTMEIDSFDYELEDNRLSLTAGNSTGKTESLTLCLRSEN